VSHSSGRIRLNQEQAYLLNQMLMEMRHRLVIRRADARDRGWDLLPFQRDIKIVSEMQEELARTMDEMRWATSQ